MAAPLVDFRNIDYGGYSFMVRFKVMRHVRYRMSRALKASWRCPCPTP